MMKIIFALVFTVTMVASRPEPPSPFADEPLEGPRHYPELLPRVRDLLISDENPGVSSSGGFGTSSAYGAPGGGQSSLGGSRSGQKEVILADPELAPLLSTFSLPSTVEKRMGSMGTGNLGSGISSGLGSQNRGFGSFGGQGLGAGGYSN